VRTTLTIDPDVAERLQQETRRSGKGLKAVVNDALRHGLGLAGKPKRSRRFTVKSHSFGFKPGIDLDRMNQLLDELEVAEATREYERE